MLSVIAAMRARYTTAKALRFIEDSDYDIPDILGSVVRMMKMSKPCFDPAPENEHPFQLLTTGTSDNDAMHDQQVD